MTGLGDSHNFGRRVSRGDGRIRKPRTLLWEWLLLCAKSPLRRLLARAARDADFGLPDLTFRSKDTPAGGEVQRIELLPLPELSRDEQRALARVVGRSIALFSFLGVADLHWENLVLGLDQRRRVVFAPLDIEMILADLSSPTETKLLPDADPEVAEICRHASGVRRVLPYLGKPIAVENLVSMVSAYRAALELLEQHAGAIGEVFKALPQLRRTPIRVLLRGTGDYVRARSEPVWPPLLDAEATQLMRGDIPYFFRLYGRAGVHYYRDASLSRLGRLPLHGDVPRLDPLLRLSRALRAPSRTRLRDEGLFTLLGAFDHAGLSGRHEEDGLAVSFGARALVVRLPDGEELESRRDLRAFVGSVYLPCGCGEVRSVFVPAVTACE